MNNGSGMRIMHVINGQNIKMIIIIIIEQSIRKSLIQALKMMFFVKFIIFINFYVKLP